MRKSSKRIATLLMAVCMMFSLLCPIASAAGDDDDTGTVSPMAHDVEYKRDRIGSETDYDVYAGPANGQPVNGTIFTSPGGFHWSDGGLFNSVTVSFGVSFGRFSTSVSVGSVGGTTGKLISAPTGVRCKLYVYRDITCTRYANYERMRGSTGPWTFTGYDDVITVTGERLEVRYGDNFSNVWYG